MKRLNNGLLEGINYVRDVTGEINWLKTLPKEYLYINPDKKAQIEKRLSKKFEDITVDEVEDSELILNLAGVKWLLRVRGFSFVDSKIDVATIDYAAATCYIEFIENEESDAQGFSASASAHAGNTRSFYGNYLVEAATNRALCRAVRNYLNINVVSKEEYGQSNVYEENESSLTSSDHPSDTLQKLLDSNGIKFNNFKNHMLRLEIKGADEWNSVKDIPTGEMFEIIGLVHKIIKDNKPKKEIK